MSNRRRIKQLKAAGVDQDRRYFHQHPEAEGYDRPATLDELKATGLPRGTMVHVKAIDTNLRVRMFQPPDVRHN